MLSAISATLFAILEAIIAYADDTPVTGLSPATDCALFFTGAALCGAGRATPLGTCFAPVAGFLTGAARGAEALLGIAPLIDGR